ncbi:MAG TPA: AIR synthase-related protein, partial [Candidatus Acidoferrales bacterium]|nr:AIR synthase-related protein [Candidatus Acidoferrales bacterium]
GEAAPGHAVTRSGARPGDILYVTGHLGGAQLGLELVLRGMYHERRWQGLLRPHFYPELRIEFGRWLASRRLASAMIDTSDGLSTDVGHLCSASRVGARLWAGHIPRVQIPPALRRHGFDPLELALHGGEDYQLLFAVPRRFEARIPRSYRRGPITAIGEVTRGRSLVLVAGDGRTTPLVPAGWNHFRSR